MAQQYDQFDIDGYDDFYQPGQLPTVVKSFIQFFHKHVKEQNVYEIHAVYDQTFNKLTARFYNDSPWPKPEQISPLVDGDRVFLTLYKELYYRHIYSKLQPTIEQRFESFENYCDLFEFILGAEQPVPLDLPNQWMWDIIDEYIYQFQSFCQYRSRLKNKTAAEKDLLKGNKDAWKVQTVLSTLHRLIKISNIEKRLAIEKEDKGTIIQPTDEGFAFGAYPLYKMLGYFSLIGLLRLHSLMGDYHCALKTIDCIEMGKKGLYARVAACHVTLYYYVGFAYMMMRRYADAINTFSSILLYIMRTKQYHTRSYQYEQMMKKNEQMYSLLAIAVSLCSQRIDENVHNVLRDKHGDNRLHMQRGEEQVFEQLFSFACPKFIIAAPRDYDADPPVNYNQEAYRLQVKLFLREVRQQSLIPTVRSYLKLYTTMAVPKLAEFLEMEESQFRTLLMAYKHKTINNVWEKGAALSGSLQSSSDVEFYVKKDTVYVNDTVVARRFGEYFIRHIRKFDEIIREV